MNAKSPLSALPGIGPALKTKLGNLKLSTIEDLIFHFPFRYDNFSKVYKISEMPIGEAATVRGEILSIKNQYAKFGRVITRAVLSDGTGKLDLAWFSQSWLIKNIKAGDKIQVSGKADKKGNKVSMLAPVWDPVGGKILNTGRIVSIYPETHGLSSKWLRLKISDLLPRYLLGFQDPLPKNIQDEMINFDQALQYIHFPENFEQVKQARERLSFDELFYIQLSTLQTKLQWMQKSSTQSLVVDQNKLDEFTKILPFKLTEAQEKVIAEIVSDIQKKHPMNRLVQGEVGSGKTVVAAAIIYLTHLNGLKSLVMAPTEILAFQHHQTLSKLLEPFGIKVGIYTGSRKFNKDKEANPDVIVGTNALLSEKLIVDNIGLIVVDEQQRFGVGQRSFLRSKAKTPHFLTMTATPIPRTVALTLYGDLDLSIIDQLPSNRKPIKTYFVPQQKRQDAYSFITKQVKSGAQVYIITPLIEESETLKSAKAAKVEFEKLQTKIFPQFKLGLLHGRLKSQEKEEVLGKFKDRKIDILVSTSVVEVGVDIPTATIMVIEGADRFGLAQLHQLRGRVGRGKDQSYTLLFTGEETPANVNRLKNLEAINNGLKLAELDLKIRGSGEIFGTAQSGDVTLKIADLSDIRLIEKARTAASKILTISPKLDKYPNLASKLSQSGMDIMPD